MWTDPDHPWERIIADETALDHARAKARGLRAMEITNLVLCALDGHALVSDPAQARVVIWTAVAESLYGLAAVDMPRMPR